MVAVCKNCKKLAYMRPGYNFYYEVVFFRFLTLFFSLVTSCSLSARFDSRLKWHSIKTDHFHIHFHQGLEKKAQKIASLLEKIHEKFSQKLDWEPYFRTDIVLVDHRDRANGYANSFPLNRITLFMSKPQMDSTLGYFDDRLDYLLIHEYTHILTIDKVYGFYQALRYIFGRIFFINSVHPAWIIEGIAVQQESLQGKGRNNSTYVDMIMRLDFLSWDHKDLTDISFHYRDWMPGSHYIYGGRFIQYLEQKYGYNSFTPVFKKQSIGIWPFTVDRNIRKVYNRSISYLWKAWVYDRTKHYQAELSKIKWEPLSKYKLISNSGFYSGHSRFDPDGEKIYFIQSSNQTATRLAVFHMNEFSSQSQFDNWKIGSKHIDTLAEVKYVRSFSVVGKERIYISQAEIFRNYSLYYDIFLYSGESVFFKLEQLSKGLRASYVDYHAPSKQFVFIRQKVGTHSLILSGHSLKVQKKIIMNSDRQLAFCRFSPSGDRIIFSFRDVSGFNQLALFDNKNNSITKLTNTKANHIQPSWHPLGEKILFSSDKTGVYNLYEIDIRSGNMLRLTNTVGGFFAPDISQDRKWITLTSYEKNGFNPALMRYPNREGKEISKIRPSRIDINYFEREEEPPPKEYGSTRFTPFQSMWPAYWIFNPILPYGYFTSKLRSSFGVSTFGRDVLELNQFTLNLRHYYGENRLGILFRYGYSGFWPDITLEYFDDTILYSDKKLEGTLLKKNIGRTTLMIQRYGRVSVIFPFLYNHFQNIFSIDYSFRKLERKKFERYDNAYLKEDMTEYLSIIRPSYSYSDFKSYSKSISPEDGRSLYLSSSISQKFLASGSQFYAIYFNYYEYLPSFFWNHVLLLALKSGVLFSDASFVRINLTSLGLRGYDSDIPDEPYGVVLSIEYRFPIWQPDTGVYDHLPFIFKDLWLDIFFDLGKGWDHKFHFSDFKRSVGAQLNTQWNLFYRTNIVFYLRYEYGFDNDNRRGFFKYGQKGFLSFGFSTSPASNPENKRKPGGDYSAW